MSFVGFDLHKKVVEVVILDETGNVIHRNRFPATREALIQFAKQHLTSETQLAVEATTNTWAVVELLEPFVGEVVVSNPMRTRAIASAKIKTDRVDAEVLAQLLRAGYLPRVWHPDAETQSMRRLATVRSCLVADRTRIKNRIHSVLHHRLIPNPDGDLFSKANLAWLAKLELDPDGRETLDRYLRLLTRIEEELEACTDKIATHAYQHPGVKLLMTIPGVDFPVAETVLAALGDITRFSDGDHAASYLGLVPSTRQSGEHCYHGRITKQGSGHARWMLVQAAQHAAVNPGPLGVFFRRLAKKKHRNVAVVATARKMVTIAWLMLKNNEPYRYSKPTTTEAKFGRLRIRATGKQKKRGPAKGTKRPAAYGTGNATRAIAAIDDVYEKENLPPLAPQSPGEKKMIEEKDLAKFAKDIRTPKRVPRESRVNKKKA